MAKLAIAFACVTVLNTWWAALSQASGSFQKETNQRCVFTARFARMDQTSSRRGRGHFTRPLQQMRQDVWRRSARRCDRSAAGRSANRNKAHLARMQPGPPTATSVNRTASPPGGVNRTAGPPADPTRTAAPPPPRDPGVSKAATQVDPYASAGNDPFRRWNSPHSDDSAVTTCSRKLGEGGMGAVYLARQVSLDRRVALKLLAPSLASDPQFVARFTREAYAAAQLTHHNIVAIHDIGSEADEHFFSMEFVEGQNTCRTRSRRTASSMPNPPAATRCRPRAGCSLHTRTGWSIADIKPDNLLLNDQGIVKVADLGLVKRAGHAETKTPAATRAPGVATVDATQMNVSMGTPTYMPPEQAVDAAHVDHRADIYSLGCTLYALLTGRPPFMGRTAGEVIAKHINEPATPPEMIVRSVPRTLSNLVMRMIAKKPEERVASMDGVITALEDFLGVAAGGVGGDPRGAREAHRIRRRTLQQIRHRRTADAAGDGVSRGVRHGCSALGRRCLIRSPPAACSGFGLLTTFAYQLLINARQKTYFFELFRGLISRRINHRLVNLAGGHRPADFHSSSHRLVVGMGRRGVLSRSGRRRCFISRSTRWSPTTAKDHAKIWNCSLNATARAALTKPRCGRWCSNSAVRTGKNSSKQCSAIPPRSKRGRYCSKATPRTAAANGRRWRDGIIEWMESKQAARRARKDQLMLEAAERRALRSEGLSETEADERAPHPRQADHEHCRQNSRSCAEASRSEKTRPAPG